VPTSGHTCLSKAVKGDVEACYPIAPTWELIRSGVEHPARWNRPLESTNPRSSRPRARFGVSMSGPALAVGSPTFQGIAGKGASAGGVPPGDGRRWWER
jgi:hypothetical protein